jgi:hypothetical protein
MTKSTAQVNIKASTEVASSGDPIKYQTINNQTFNRCAISFVQVLTK